MESPPLPPRAWEQATMFANRVAKNFRKLEPWAKRHAVSCFRLYDRDIPEVPFVVDWYDGRLHFAEYVRPHDRTESEHQAWLDEMVSACAENMAVSEDECWLKRRERQRGTAQYPRFAREGAIFVVGEQGLQFQVNLSDYLDTGLFLDHRITRQRVREMAKGKRLLNLFAYTGSFSVYAAAGGAAMTTTVDLSATYLDWARENMGLNGFYGARFEFEREDTLQFLRQARLERRQWDIIVLDPPTFSNSARMHGDVFEVQRDHRVVIQAALDVLAPGGTLWFSTNFRKFRLGIDGLKVGKVTDVSAQTIPPDFRNTRIHQCWRIEAPGGTP